MRYSAKTIAVAGALFAAASFGAQASPAGAIKQLSEVVAPAGLSEIVAFRRAHWRAAYPCRRGGRFYTYGGGWGCDYYLYGLWPARPPRRW